MRLLLVNYEYPPVGGGAANATANIARALVELGHIPIVLTGAFASEPARSEIQGVRVIRVAARRVRADRSDLFEMMTYVVAAAIALPRVLRTERPDGAIVFFSLPCGPLGLLAQWRAGVPYLISLRGGDVPGGEAGLGAYYLLLTPVRRWVLRRATAVVANSNGLRLLSEAADPITAEVIPNGVDVDFFRPSKVRNDGNFNFLFVGRLQSQKNLPFLLDAAAALRRETAEPFRLTIVGDGPERLDLQRKCTALGLDDVVTWHGWSSKTDLLRQYQAADCLVNPSLSEGMPNTALEAMACGVPVLASNVRGNDAVVIEGTTGFLVGIDDVYGFTAPMRRLLEAPGMARNMGEAARIWVSREFSWHSTARQYVELFAKSNIPRCPKAPSLCGCALVRKSMGSGRKS